MPSAYDIVVGLTVEKHNGAERLRMLRDFAQEMGWRPSYYIIETPVLGDFSNAHLVVEHGLQPSAVITFLSDPHRLADIQLTDQYRLLGISYNNLVDWHLYVEPNEITFCFNRLKPAYIESKRISRSNYDCLRNEAFDQIVERKPLPNLPSLDQALIDTISTWRRVLTADLGYEVPSGVLSALLNAILFVRTIEDHQRRAQHSYHQLLVEKFETISDTDITFRKVIMASLAELIGSRVPRYLIDETKLARFDLLSRDTIHDLFTDFYINRFAPYNYDFSIMSKHALSRIYERYTALLHLEETSQSSFFPRIPEEEWNKRHGSVYTPQFIARYFARFLKNQLPPKLFRNMKSIDPACGSGIFLRTLLEFQCDPIQDDVNSEVIRKLFDNTQGWDIDENATNATLYSLASLFMVLTDTLPEQLQIVNTESIEYYLKNVQLRGTFDSVIVNPPFVSFGSQDDEFRKVLASFMSDEAKGRIDTYLAFLKLSLELLKSGGYGLFVLPHSFLLAKSAHTIRKRLSMECWIHCLADLSAIRVFGDLGTYIVLLIFQKKGTFIPVKPPVTIIKCQDYAGVALEDALEGRFNETPSYSVYEADQDEFNKEQWIVLPANEKNIRAKLEIHPKLSDFVEIREGLITGADDVFIIDKRRVPSGDEGIYVPFLPDREMGRYDVPVDTLLRVFYPFKNGQKLAEDDLRSQYKRTWDYLKENKPKLERRLPVQRGQLRWWEPVRPRSPELLLRPKVVSPHLVMIPRFSIDKRGIYAVSRASYLYTRLEGVDMDLLYFLVVILNSPVCYWYISTHSHKYGRGYTMLEPKTLKPVPVPDPANVPGNLLENLLSLVKLRIETPKDASLERDLDKLTAELYGLSEREMEIIGIR